jgi:hypothetical protein
VSLEPSDRGYVSQRLLALSKEFAGQAGAIVDVYHTFKQAERAYSVAKAKALLNAPTHDPRDAGRRFTADDRKAWVEVEVSKLADALLVADVANRYQQEAVWARNKELDALQTLSADARAEMKLA